MVEPTTIDLLRALQRIERNLTLATASAECPRCGEMVTALAPDPQLETMQARLERVHRALREIIRVADTTYWDDPSAGVQAIARRALSKERE
ncbi:MAG: hypothetical protein KatS3mg015_2519 [Fimbriimonadales bacterium]|nr:MAG: hypothetical protein KatS3mg015_2519 [Fimbriimonadales bacterium]